MKERLKVAAVLKILIPLVILVVLIIAYFIRSNKNVFKDEFSLARYVLFTVEGVDTRGKVTLSIDEVGLYGALSQIYGVDDPESYYGEFIDSLQVSADKTDGISNGDVININVDYDKGLATRLGIDVDVVTRTVKVTELKQGEKINLFSDVKIITGGISPYVYATYVNESENDFLASLEYDISKTDGLAIGEEIEIICVVDEKTAAAEGYYYDVNVMTYTITKADKYVDNPAEVDRELMDSLREDNIQVIKNETADTTYRMSYKVTGRTEYLYRDNNEEAVSFALDRVVLANNDSGVKREHENYLLAFYKGSIALPRYTTEADPYDYVNAYFCFLYSDAVLAKDGKFLMATNEPEKRYVCGESFEAVMAVVEEIIGKEYVFQDLK